MSGHRHAMISLICMSTHKATTTRCLSHHQAASGQPAIQALATAPLRRLTLSVLFTIATNSYQTTCTVSKRTFNKRQHASARHGVDFSHFTHYDTSLQRKSKKNQPGDHLEGTTLVGCFPTVDKFFYVHILWI